VNGIREAYGLIRYKIKYGVMIIIVLSFVPQFAVVRALEGLTK
jgi:hypothetical protein